MTHDRYGVYTPRKAWMVMPTYGHSQVGLQAGWRAGAGYGPRATSWTTLV